jgi:hypothetical protein
LWRHPHSSVDAEGVRDAIHIHQSVLKEFVTPSHSSVDAEGVCDAIHIHQSVLMEFVTLSALFSRC